MATIVTFDEQDRNNLKDMYDIMKYGCCEKY